MGMKPTGQFTPCEVDMTVYQHGVGRQAELLERHQQQLMSPSEQHGSHVDRQLHHGVVHDVQTRVDAQTDQPVVNQGGSKVPHFSVMQVR